MPFCTYSTSLFFYAHNGKNWSPGQKRWEGALFLCGSHDHVSVFAFANKHAIVLDCVVRDEEGEEEEGEEGPKKDLHATVVVMLQHTGKTVSSSPLLMRIQYQEREEGRRQNKSFIAERKEEVDFLLPFTFFPSSLPDIQVLFLKGTKKARGRGGGGDGSV